MKKSLKLILCVCFVILLCGCGKKEAVESKNLNSSLTSLGYTVSDVTNEIEDENIVNITVANNGKIQIDYYKFKSEDLAKKAYKNNKKSFINLSDTKYSEKNKDTYDEFTQELTDKYNYLIRVGDTLIYSSTNIEYKKDLKDALKKLNL